jgi:hypothetical protein
LNSKERGFWLGIIFKTKGGDGNSAGRRGRRPKNLATFFLDKLIHLFLFRGKGGKIMRRAALIVGLVVVLGMMSFAWGAEKKVVRVWHTETEPQSVAAFQQIINDYEKKNPDVTVIQGKRGHSF